MGLIFCEASYGELDILDSNLCYNEVLPKRIVLLVGRPYSKDTCEILGAK